MENYQAERGYFGGPKSLHGLAMMTVFLDTSKIVEQRTDSIEALELTVSDFLDQFTNYGCYCWILGKIEIFVIIGENMSMFLTLI